MTKPLIHLTAAVRDWRRTLIASALVLAGAAASAQAAGPMEFLFTGSGMPRAQDVARDAKRVWKTGEYSALALQPREAGSPPNQQPVKVAAEALRARLATIEFKSTAGDPLALFSADELGDMVPALVQALAAAGPGDDLLLLSTARRESGFLTMPMSVTARLFVADGALNLIVDSARLDAVSKFRASRIAPALAFGRRGAASAVSLGSAVGQSRRGDWLVFALTEGDRLAPPPQPLLAPAAGTAPLVAAPAAAAPALVAPAAPAAAPPAAPQPRDDRFYDEQSQRLKGLQRLRDQGLISEAEFQQKRREILQAL